MIGFGAVDAMKAAIKNSLTGMPVTGIGSYCTAQRRMTLLRHQ